MQNASLAPQFFFWLYFSKNRNKNSLLKVKKILAEKNSTLRRASVLALRYLGGNEARELLRSLANDADSWVAWSALNTLVYLDGKEASKLLETALQRKKTRNLDPALEKEVAHFRIQGIASLGSLGGDLVFDLLTQLALDKDETIRNQAKLSLKLIGYKRAIKKLGKAYFK
jgi:HEAT repeat protein